ncbi:hypothetical protein FSP39_004884 [Pinctada imbricata]|uniref:Thioredoxin domain-containing protein n=1 Tax=Pinctada imbricata TaxID=66713 RepID=A0AA88XQ02_PINIB|nr:hypothetical protein FSP39_004884 [Pinctada imbricata]
MSSRCLSRVLSGAVRCAASIRGRVTYQTTSLIQHHPHFPAITQVCSRLVSSSADKFVCINIQDSKHFQEEVQENTLPVIVDFHANWCGPCKLLGPRLESIVSSTNGKVILAKVDVDDHGDLAMRYGVNAVPTVIAFKNGKNIDKFQGLIDDDRIITFVEKLL